MGGKYGAIRTKFNGRSYASKAEASWARYFEEELKQRRIRSIEYQPAVELIPKPNRIKYVADFLITYNDGTEEYFDVKGMETAVFKLKHKMFRHFYPDLKLTIVN